MMGDIKYLKEESTKGNIVTRVFNGDISKQDIINSFKHMNTNKLLDNSSIGLITVISNSTINMNMEDLEGMISFMSNNKNLSNLKIAVVSSDPDKIVLPTLVHFKIGETLKPFGSMEEAKEWISS